MDSTLRSSSKRWWLPQMMNQELGLKAASEQQALNRRASNPLL
jgi:hypothetical protein